MRYAESPERSTYVFTASVDDLMRLAGSNDGSPASVHGYISKEMIRELFPESRGIPVVCCLPHSYRALACGENNYHPQTVMLKVVYDDRYDSMPMDRQLTCTRGTIIAQTDPDRVRYVIRQYAGFVNSLDELPTIDERRERYHKELESVAPETIAVSYIGRERWGSLEEYIENFTIESASISAPVMFAFVPVGGLFHITMTLNQTSEVYVRTMVRLFEEHGITADYLYGYRQELCRVAMP